MCRWILRRGNLITDCREDGGVGYSDVRRIQEINLMRFHWTFAQSLFTRWKSNINSNKSPERFLFVRWSEFDLTRSDLSIFHHEHNLQQFVVHRISSTSPSFSSLFADSNSIHYSLHCHNSTEATLLLGLGGLFCMCGNILSDALF